MLSAGIPQEVEQNFVDTRCYLANLYKYCLKERPHLQTKKGLAAVEATRTSSAVVYINQVNYLQQWMIFIILILMKANFKNVNYEYPPPKVSDAILLGLIKHTFFDGKDIAEYVYNDKLPKDHTFKLNSRQKNCLRALALRLT